MRHAASGNFNETTSGVCVARYSCLRPLTLNGSTALRTLPAARTPTLNETQSRTLLEPSLGEARGVRDLHCGRCALAHKNLWPGALTCALVVSKLWQLLRALC